MKRNNKKGFTIVELVIVIAVIAILAAVMIPTFGTIVADANKSAAIQVARSKYTEITTADITDDGLYNNSKNVSETDLVYNVAENTTTGVYEIKAFSYKHTNGYTATLNVATGEWSAAK